MSTLTRNQILSCAALFVGVLASPPVGALVAAVLAYLWRGRPRWRNAFIVFAVLLVLFAALAFVPGGELGI